MNRSRLYRSRRRFRRESPVARLATDVELEAGNLAIQLEDDIGEGEYNDTHIRLDRVISELDKLVRAGRTDGMTLYDFSAEVYTVAERLERIIVHADETNTPDLDSTTINLMIESVEAIYRMVSD